MHFCTCLGFGQIRPRFQMSTDPRLSSLTPSTSACLKTMVAAMQQRCHECTSSVHRCPLDVYADCVRVTMILTCRLQAPQYPQNPPPDFPIHVNEDDASVTVAAGISQRLLLDYLANFKYAPAPHLKTIISMVDLTLAPEKCGLILLTCYTCCWQLTFFEQCTWGQSCQHHSILLSTSDDQVGMPIDQQIFSTKSGQIALMVLNL